MALGMLLLVYVCARFGAELAGTAGAATTVALFVAAEAVLFLTTGARVADPPRLTPGDGRAMIRRDAPTPAPAP
jgi:hypothetical protein